MRGARSRGAAATTGASRARSGRARVTRAGSKAARGLRAGTRPSTQRARLQEDAAATAEGRRRDLYRYARTGCVGARRCRRAVAAVRACATVRGRRRQRAHGARGFPALGAFLGTCLPSPRPQRTPQTHDATHGKLAVLRRAQDSLTECIVSTIYRNLWLERLPSVITASR